MESEWRISKDIFIYSWELFHTPCYNHWLVGYVNPCVGLEKYCSSCKKLAPNHLLIQRKLLNEK